MQKYLSNLALILLTEKATELKLLPKEGTKLYKYNRRQIYSLLNGYTGRTIISITFFANKVPYYFIQPNN